MLAFVGTGLLLTFSILLVHYRQHFKCKRCSKQSSYQSKNCCIIPIDDTEEFDFFPISFLYYVAFMAVLCILLIIKIILLYHTWTDIVYIIYSNITNDFVFNHYYSFQQLHRLDIPRDNIFIYIIDLFVIYGTMISSLYESLFIFHKYYTTKLTAKSLNIVSIKQVIAAYLLYAIPFIIIFISIINVYYWLYPILIILHITFNLYCTLKFSSLLINRFTTFNISKFQSEIVPQLYFMRNIAVIGNILQSLYISIFIMAYNVNIMYYLPILWSMQCILFALNFVRNRSFFKCKCCRTKIKISCWKKKSRPNFEKKNLGSRSPISPTPNTNILNDDPFDINYNTQQPPSPEPIPPEPINIQVQQLQNNGSLQDAQQIVNHTKDEIVIKSIKPQTKDWRNNGSDSVPSITTILAVLDPKKKDKREIEMSNNSVQSKGLDVLQENIETNGTDNQFGDGINNNDEDEDDALSLSLPETNLAKQAQSAPDAVTNRIQQQLTTNRATTNRANSLRWAEEIIHPYDILAKHGFISTQTVISTKENVTKILMHSLSARQVITSHNNGNPAWSDNKSQTDWH